MPGSNGTSPGVIVHTRSWLHNRVDQWKAAHYGLHIGTSGRVRARNPVLAAVYAWAKSDTDWAQTWAEIRVKSCGATSQVLHPSQVLRPATDLE